MIDCKKLPLLFSVIEESGYLNRFIRLFKAEFFSVSSQDTDFLCSVPVYYSNVFEQLEMFVKSILFYYNSGFLKKRVRCRLSSFDLSISIPIGDLDNFLKIGDEVLTELNLNVIMTLDSIFFVSI